MSKFKVAGKLRVPSADSGYNLYFIVPNSGPSFHALLVDGTWNVPTALVL